MEKLEKLLTIDELKRFQEIQARKPERNSIKYRIQENKGARYRLSGSLARYINRR